MKLGLLIALGMAPLAASCVSLPATSSQGGDEAAIERMLAGESQMQGGELDKEVAEAASAPLGSQDNPVRAHMPAGERAYLSRLRCEDGRVPSFSRVGSMGFSRYGNIVDGYDVVCKGSAPAKTLVYIDMYHRGHVETEAVPGFTIVAP